MIKEIVGEKIDERATVLKDLRQKEEEYHQNFNKWQNEMHSV